MDRFRSLARRGVAGALLAVVVCASVTGCGSGRGEVSGVVRCNGKPLPFGTIQSLGADGVPHAATIQPDGTFSVQVPAGEAKVIISCLDESRMKRVAARSAASSGRAAPLRWTRGGLSLIPRRYADWNTSGLTVLVESGKTVRDFALTSR